MSLKRFLPCLFTSIIINIITSFAIKAQVICDSVFMKEYTATGNIEPYATKNLNNNQVLIAGAGTVSPGAAYQAMAVKLSSTGSVLWSVLIGGNTDDRFTGIVVLNDGSYLLYGTTQSFGFAEGKILLVHITSDGSLLWSRQLGTLATSKDRIKGIMQYNDGDIIGTFNSDDSTSQSNPVVFKMGLDGSVKWAREFDNNGEESFTSIAFESNKIYVSGFYTEGKKKGVIVVLNSVDGSVNSAQNIYINDINYTQEVNSLEVYNNKISYGLSMRLFEGNALVINREILIQTDLAGNITFQTISGSFNDVAGVSVKRTFDDGFLVSPYKNDGYSPVLQKINKYYLLEWTTFLSNSNYNPKQNNFGIDQTISGGGISAGYYQDFFSGGVNKMIVVKTNAFGEAGNCSATGNSFFTQADSISVYQKFFSWPTALLISPSINQSIAPVIVNNNITESTLCDSIYCKDITPLPLPCNKTSLVEYASSQTTVLRDAVNTSDGGSVAVGDMQSNGWLIKFKSNGDVDWSKKEDQPDQNTQFLRVLKTSDNNIIAFANTDYIINHGANRIVRAIKFDNNGNILFSKDIIKDYYTQITDVCATGDGGFVVILNGCYGCGYIYSYVIRFNRDLQVVWKKELKHFVMVPVYRSIFCTADAVYIGHDNYNDNGAGIFGIQKLEYATGNDLWSKRLAFANNTNYLNKLIVSNDTIYTFISTRDLVTEIGQVFLCKLTSAGNVINSKLLGGDKIITKSLINAIDAVSPNVTITPNNDFVMSNRVQTSNGPALNITRFDKYGEALWSKNYPQLQAHNVYNIHSQGNGFLIIGTVIKTRLSNPFFTNSFLLKIDSAGNITENAIGYCANEIRPFTAVPVTITEINSLIDSIVDMSGLIVSNANTTELAVSTDATLYCSEQSNCAAINLVSRGNGCSLQDTLVYLLAGNNCGAAATWKYDATFFKMLSETGDSIKLLPKTTGMFTITAEIQTPCSVTTQSMVVSILISASKVNLGSDTSICPGNTITLKAGPGYASYRWNNSSTDSVLAVSSPGIYFVEVTDNCGGRATDTIQVNPVGNDFHIDGDSVKCNKDSVLLLASAGYNNYQWIPSINVKPNGNNAIVNPTQTTNYFVQAERSPGCIVKDSFLLTVKNSPVIYLGKDTTLCFDKSIRLTATSGFSNYVWSTGSQAPAIDIYDPGFYFVSATFPNNCISKDSIDIKKYTFIQPRLGNDTSICGGNNFMLFPGNFISYLWSNQVSNSNSIPVIAAGEYWVKVTDQYGCMGSDTINILDIYQSPGNFLNDKISICFGDNVMLQPTKQFATYQWSTGAVSNNISVDQLGTYLLFVTDSKGCTGKDTIAVIKKQDCPTTIFFVNAFTPNKDGKNEIFKPIITGQMEKYRLVIYNRYGKLIFSTNNSSLGWDGIFNGELQPSGNYIFSCNYKFLDNREVTKNGNFILVR